MVRQRQPSLQIVVRNQTLVETIKIIKQDHPFWGYRRIWTYVNYHLKFMVNKKRVYRLMSVHHLLVKERRKLKAKRAAYRSKPRANRPNHIWGTEMTKVKLPHVGWVYIVLVLDWHVKKIVGHSIALRSKTQDWLDAMTAACDLQFPRGVRANTPWCH